MWRMAFDIGGTFTDFVLAGADLPPRFLKVATTPDDPAAAVIGGFERLLAEAGVEAAALSTVLHATTVATNAIIERKGSPTALLTTAGFRDVLIIGRQKRYETYDLHMEKPPPLVPRRAIFEVEERLAPDGALLTPLNMASVDEAILAALEMGAESIAVALLHAYADPAHEQAIAARLAERAPGVPVSLSSTISPKFREYERTSTTVANAYVRPLVRDYVGRLRGALGERGFSNDFFIMQSAGGLISPEIAEEEPVRIVESGPAAGVLMAAEVGRAAGEDHVITFDMGGTTAKLGAVDGGRPAVTQTFEIDPIRYRPGSGLPLNVPAVELLEIGAGGGSIARADIGVIHVGPESAGADPGPICYGRGGGRPTVSDANLVLGYLNPDYFNAGEMALDLEAARNGIERDIARPLDLAVERAAWGVHAAANANMERAMRIVSVERGRDPRRFAVLAFGGAGPVHAARLAQALGAPRVIVPFGAGVGSAVGLLGAAPRIEATTTRVVMLEAGIEAAVGDIFQALEARARGDIARLGVAGEPVWSRAGYLRYQGQGYEIRAELPAGEIGPGYAAAAAEAFHQAYEASYGYRDEGAGIEAVDWHLIANFETLGQTLDLGWRPAPQGARPEGERLAWFEETGGYTPTRVLDRAGLVSGAEIAGPAIVEEAEATSLVPPGMSAHVDDNGNLVIETGVEK